MYTPILAAAPANILDQIWIFLQNSGPKILLAVAVLVIGLILVKAIERLIKRLLKKSRIEETAHKIIIQISSICLKFVVVLVAIETLGIKTTSLIAVLGAAGLAVGLAIQDSLGNLAGGFLVLFSKPFTKGDFIETNSVSGTVHNITLFYTTLITPDNKKIFVPNGEISTAKIINYSAEPTRRLDLTFQIGYGDDIARAKQVLAEVVESSGLALSDPAPAYLVSEHSASAVSLAVRIWVKTDDYWDLNFYMIEQVKLAFDKAGISIPFEQLDVHVVSNTTK